MAGALHNLTLFQHPQPPPQTPSHRTACRLLRFPHCGKQCGFFSHNSNSALLRQESYGPLRPHVACVLSKAWSPPQTRTAWELGEKQAMLVLLLKIDKHSQGRFWLFLHQRLALSIVNAKQQCRSLRFQGLTPVSGGLVQKHTSAWPIPTGGDELP